ncbi:hypothetical protein LTR08_008575 [Meristemomyces frigidus]|nr:hypothetical protein LTR08_008575 [Meristemomyces frigidus]
MSPPNTAANTSSATRKTASCDITMTDAEPMTPSKSKKEHSRTNSPAVPVNAHASNRKVSRRDRVVVNTNSAQQTGPPQQPERRSGHPVGSLLQQGRGTPVKSVPGLPQRPLPDFAALMAQQQRGGQRSMAAGAPAQQRLGGPVRLASGQTQPQQRFGGMPGLAPGQGPPPQRLGGPLDLSPEQGPPPQRPGGLVRQAPGPAPPQQSSNPTAAPPRYRHIPVNIDLSNLENTVIIEGEPPLTAADVAGINKLMQGFDMVTKYFVEEKGFSPQQVALALNRVRERKARQATAGAKGIDWDAEEDERNEELAKARSKKEELKEGKMEGGGGEGGEGGKGGKGSQGKVAS